MCFTLVKRFYLWYIMIVSLSIINKFCQDQRTRSIKITCAGDSTYSNDTSVLQGVKGVL